MPEVRPRCFHPRNFSPPFAPPPSFRPAKARFHLLSLNEVSIRDLDRLLSRLNSGSISSFGGQKSIGLVWRPARKCSPSTAKLPSGHRPQTEAGTSRSAILIDAPAATEEDRSLDTAGATPIGRVGSALRPRSGLRFSKAAEQQSKPGCGVPLVKDLSMGRGSASCVTGARGKCVLHLASHYLSSQCLTT
jgi:hypothetical protein